MQLKLFKEHETNIGTQTCQRIIKRIQTAKKHEKKKRSKWLDVPLINQTRKQL